MNRRSVIDGCLMADGPEAATVKEYLTAQTNGRRRGQLSARECLYPFDENRRIAEARQADAEEIAELERIEKQLQEKKEKR